MKMVDIDRPITKANAQNSICSVDSFIRAAPPTHAEPLYQEFCRQLGETSGCRVKQGVFGGDMKVSLVNDGPVTIVIDSRAKE